MSLARLAQETNYGGNALELGGILTIVALPFLCLTHDNMSELRRNGWTINHPAVGRT